MSDLGTDALLALVAALDRNTAALEASTRARPAASGSTQASGGGRTGARRGPVVRMGRDKGKTLGEVADLSWYRKVIAENVNDSAKAKFHAENVETLRAIDEELRLRSGGPASPPPPDPSDDWGPGDEPNF